MAATKKNRSKLLAAIIILTIIGGVWSIIFSFPFLKLYSSIEQGGITVNDKVSILFVLPNTPAEEADLQEGDTIVSINGKTISSSSEFVEATNTNQGKEIPIVFERNGFSQTVRLVPRVNPQPNEGRIGVAIADIGIEKKSTSEIIPHVIIDAYSISKQKPSFLFSTESYQNNESSGLQTLFVGIINLAIGIGLWKWKRWAFYGYLLSTAYFVIYFIPYLINPAHYSSASKIEPIFLSIQRTPDITDTLMIIFGLFINILIAYYIFRQKRLFQ